MKFTVRDLLWLLALGAVLANSAWVRIQCADMKEGTRAIFNYYDHEIDLLTLEVEKLRDQDIPLWQQAHGNINDIHERLKTVEQR